MKQTWRWFGPADTIAISDLPQVGVEGVVSALHHFPPGQVWPLEEIKLRCAQIERNADSADTGLTWDVAESLPISEDIKRRTGDYRAHIAAYCESLRNLAACGVHVICYNFMPVLDWTRTDLALRMPHGGTAMYFDLHDFAAFDLFILARPDAKTDYSPATIDAAKTRFDAMSAADKTDLQNNIIAGLPGANDSWDLTEIEGLLDSYSDITPDTLRGNLIAFLRDVTPVAEELGLRLCCHPDDPPFPLLGLPRIMSSESDFQQVCDAVDSPSSGITFCTGSLGVNADFDAAGFVKRLGHRIHFAHLRNTTRNGPTDGARSSFYEAAHLEGDTDIVATLHALVAETLKRKAAGRADWNLPMRPDHGQDLLADLDQNSMPGYPLIGRMRGLAELRGIMKTCQVILSQ